MLNVRKSAHGSKNLEFNCHFILVNLLKMQHFLFFFLAKVEPATVERHIMSWKKDSFQLFFPYCNCFCFV